MSRGSDFATRFVPKGVTLNLQIPMERTVQTNFSFFKSSVMTVALASIAGSSFAGMAGAAGFQIVENLYKDQHQDLRRTLFDGYGSPVGTTLIVPTSTEAAQYIAGLNQGGLYACRLEFPTAEPSQIFTASLRCIPQARAFRLETSQTATLSLEKVYDAIEGNETVVDEDMYSVMRVKEDELTSCQRYYAKPPMPFTLTTSCVFNRHDILTGRVYSCTNEGDCI